MKKKILYVVLLLIALMPFMSLKALDSKNYFKAGDTVSSNEKVNHSHFLAGNKVTSKGKINGILFMAGNTLKAKNSLEYGFIAGNVIEISGNIEKDAFIAGNDITVEDSAKIGRDLYIAGNTVEINSNVDGNIFITSSTVEFNNVTIKGDVNIDSESIKIRNNVKIEGTLKYNEDAKIDGNIKGIKTKTYKIENDNKETILNKVSSKLYSSISLILISIIIVLIYPKLYKKLSKEVTVSRVFKKLLEGLCILLVVPFGSIFLITTILGIPLAVISLLLYGIFIYLSLAVSSTVIGNIVLTKLLKKNDGAYLSILIGVLLVELVTLIPYIGGLIYFLLMLIGLSLIFELIKPTKIK